MPGCPSPRRHRGTAAAPSRAGQGTGQGRGPLAQHKAPGAHHAAPTMDRPTQMAMPRLAQKYGEMFLNRKKM